MKLLNFFLASMMSCSLLLEISEFVQEAIKGDKWFLFVIRNTEFVKAAIIGDKENTSSRVALPIISNYPWTIL